MSDNRLLAIQEFADKAHGEQKRKYTGERYVVHPVKVMEILKHHTNNPVILAAALLHDVLEDTTVSENEMRTFLNKLDYPLPTEEIITLVIELTDVFTKKNYPHLNRKKRKRLEFARLANASANAQTIKYADVLDNTRDVVEYDRDFGLTFLREAKAMLPCISKGNPDLYKKVINTVDEYLRVLDRIDTNKKPV
jgi:guanosine-3',5'-bis(diphosphate) 3'-pyrophosphohydrolase